MSVRSRTRVEAEEIFNGWPEEDPILAYDDFFIGGSTGDELPGYNTECFSDQLTGIVTVQDLKNPPSTEALVEAVDDFDQFVVDQVNLLHEDRYGELFFAVKRDAFRLFGFSAIRSGAAGDVPLQEVDLVLDENDYYILEYLKTTTSDYFKVAQVALLVAYDNMGVDTVRFCQQDGCPLCVAHEGLFYRVNSLMDRLCSGGNVPHPYCESTWAPVIDRSSYYGPLLGHLNVERLEHGGVELLNVPAEYVEEIKLIAEKLDFERIRFVNMVDYSLNDSSYQGDLDGVVVLVEEDTLVVHNGYVGINGPVEFLREFSRPVVNLSKISLDDVRDPTVYYVGGRSAVRHEGKFWDASTGERLA